MSFYSTSLKHPSVRTQFSGETEATDTPTPLVSEDQCVPNGVWLKNEDAAVSVRVFAPDMTNGFLLSPNTSRFFPVSNAKDLLIQTAGDTNADVSYWAG